jgi:hypothetical protein
VRRARFSIAMAAVNSAPTDSQALVKDFLDSNPQLETEPGEVAVMTDRYTNQEWARQIRETQRKVVVNEGEQGARRYMAPAVGSKEFAGTIDHTLLKLDATTKQIDALCAEARTEEFKVSYSFFVDEHVGPWTHYASMFNWNIQQHLSVAYSNWCSTNTA